MEHGNLTYKEMAERTGVHEYTIFCITRELGLRRTHSQWAANISRKRKELFRKERARVTFGLEQQTRLKVFCNKKKTRLRARLKMLGYISSEDGNTLYYSDSIRRRPVREQHGMAMGLRFEPLPGIKIDDANLAESC